VFVERFQDAHQQISLCPRLVQKHATNAARRSMRDITAIESNTELAEKDETIKTE
jgi:hypothetical protein